MLICLEGQGDTGLNTKQTQASTKIEAAPGIAGKGGCRNQGQKSSKSCRIIVKDNF